MDTNEVSDRAAFYLHYNKITFNYNQRVWKSYTITFLDSSEDKTESKLENKLQDKISTNRTKLPFNR